MKEEKGKMKMNKKRNKKKKKKLYTSEIFFFIHLYLKFNLMDLHWPVMWAQSQLVPVNQKLK